jgi:hypothetical protein
MDPFKARGNRQNGPESKIQNGIIEKLRGGDWLVVVTHGNEFQKGLPDLWCAHVQYGTRWIEVKNTENYRFTPAQLKLFPEMYAKGVGVWVLQGSSPQELQKLFSPCNFWQYLPNMRV